MAGYSATPQIRKLGIKPEHILVIHGPDADWALDDSPVEPMSNSSSADVVLAFVREAALIDGTVEKFQQVIFPAGALWIAWPRKAGGHVSDVNENLIRNSALARGLVDVKVAAIDEDWSGLKLVWRKENR
ncbi:MAG: DUF3052 domain-containing protein [Nocardiaceae bacterium]|nr:DUF3052 domain-containing protein [Nocardiaceae bacterium]